MGTATSPESTNQDAFTDDDVLTEGPKYNEPPPKTRLKWYRAKLTKDQLAELNRRSDLFGALQTLGHLGILALSVGTALYSYNNWPWYVTAILVFVNGHFWQFLVNGFHELVHDSVFRTKFLNRVFLWVFSFLGWHNHHLFWASHTEHHKYTLHPPDDQEVVLPQRFDLGSFWNWSIINWRYPHTLLKAQFKKFTGYIDMQNAWTASLLPESDPGRRRAYVRWERFLLVGHLLIAGAAIASGYWILILLVTFPKAFGTWLQWLCNQAQHAGLQDKVEDYRLCCRTIYLNPIVQYLYWHMNYHTEHHMYAAVPCYRLPKLHRMIKHELPHCPRGLRETWRIIAEIQDRQDQDPGYQFVAQLPS